MNAPTNHPSWCAPGACTAFSTDPYLEHWHRSNPIVVPDPTGSPLLAWLYADQGDTEPAVEVLRTDIPIRARFWTAPGDDWVISLDQAGALSRGLRHLLAAARGGAR